MTAANVKQRQKQTKSELLGVLIIGRKRPGFDQEWNATIRRGAIAALLDLGFDCVGADEPVIDDDTIDAALAEIRTAGCRALIVLQPSLGNGQLALTVAQQWRLPVVLWATPERPDGEKVSSCSLVAQHLWASILRQANHPFEFVYGDTEDESVRQSLRQAISISSAAAALSTAKLGLIGGHAPGFIAMQADTFALKRQLGTQLHSLSLTQFMDRARTLADADVKRDIEEARALDLPMKGVTAGDLATNSRIYLAMWQLIEEEGLSALAIQCWPEMPNTLGQWPYLAISRLAEEGFAVAMEGDTDGALTCLAAKALGAGSGFITDWLEHDDQTIHFWHPGTAPLGMCVKPSLGVHFNIPKPLVVDGALRVGEAVTIARLWRCDDRYFMTAFEGQTIPLRRTLSGNAALVTIDGGSVSRWFDQLCHAGLPHHPVLFYGRHADSFRRLARTMGINWIAKES